MKQKRERKHANRNVPIHDGNRPGWRQGRTIERGKIVVCGKAVSVAYNSQSYGRAITRAAKKAGVPHWSPGQLRHTRGTEVRKDYGLDAAASTLGHSQVMTTQIFAELDEERAIQVARENG